MRLIDADALKQADFQDFSNTDVLCAIDEAPTIDAVPVVRGRWEEMRNPYGGLEGWIHKKCGRTTKEASSYCPNCGAQMEHKP